MGDWELGMGYGELGQSPIPQSPIPNPHLISNKKCISSLLLIYQIKFKKYKY